MAWHGIPDEHKVVWHKDGNRGNNRPTNIIWLTHKEAEQNNILCGYSNRKNGDKHHSTRITEVKRRQIAADLKKGMSVREISRKYNLSITPIYNIKKTI
jgi:predicted alpha/beta superfamily hydrolase